LKWELRGRGLREVWRREFDGEVGLEMCCVLILMMYTCIRGNKGVKLESL